MSASKVVGLEPTTLILETKVLPIKLYLLSLSKVFMFVPIHINDKNSILIFIYKIDYLMRESNPRRRIKSPLHYHYANQAFGNGGTWTHIFYMQNKYSSLLNYIPKNPTHRTWTYINSFEDYCSTN